MLSASTPLSRVTDDPLTPRLRAINTPQHAPLWSNFFQARLPLRTAVKHVLVDVDEEGCYFRLTPERRYGSLDDLVRGSPVLKTLYKPEWRSEERGAAA